MAKKIFITAGELSGDLNASLLVREVKRLSPSVEFVGVGGPKMRDAGVRLLADSTAWGSVGFLEGVARFPRVYPTLRAMPKYFRDEAPDVYVPVDYRVFSVRNARTAKALGIPVIYYFAPVNWFGSGAKRFVQMAGLVDLALVALPLSLEQYKEAGIPYEYIGHPLVDAAVPTMSREEAATFFGVDASQPIIGLMPGSRFQEVGRMTSDLTRAAGLIREKVPHAQFLLFLAADSLEPLVKKRMGNAQVKIVRRNVYDFMNLCDVLALCSGTATHEAALMMKPMVLVYKVSAATAWLIRKTVNPPMIGLPNILAGEMIIPELVQEECTPEMIADKTLAILSSRERREKMVEALRKVKEKMGEPGAATRAAMRIIEQLDAKVAG